MINSTSLKRNIYEETLKGNFETETDRMITSALLFSAIQNSSKTNSSISFSSTSYIESFLPTYISLVTEAKQRYVSYFEMKKLVESSGFSSFIQFSDKLIRDINTLYSDKTEIVDFNILNFSQYMYKVKDLSLQQRKKLSKIHFNVMVPIAKYFYDNNGISHSNLEIANSELVKDFPGKEITFSIKNIPPSVIISKIKNGSIEISDYIHVNSLKVSGEFVDILMK